MSSWLPNTVAHGTPRLREAEMARSQYRLALGIGRLFAVTRSPRYTTKSEWIPPRPAAAETDDRGVLFQSFGGD
jgi:hypothetical protein